MAGMYRYSCSQCQQPGSKTPEYPQRVLTLWALDDDEVPVCGECRDKAALIARNEKAELEEVNQNLQIAKSNMLSQIAEIYQATAFDNMDGTFQVRGGTASSRYDLDLAIKSLVIAVRNYESRRRGAKLRLMVRESRRTS